MEGAGGQDRGRERGKEDIMVSEASLCKFYMYR